MTTSTPRLNVGIPDEFEEPYARVARVRDLAWDTTIFANAENGQLQFLGGGVMGWDAAASSPTRGVLFWSDTIFVSAFSTTFRARLLPAPAASVELEDGEVLFFVMPRNMLSTPDVELFKANRIFLEGTRLPDLRLFCARVGTTLYFYNGLSLRDEDQGVLFGAGLDPVSIIPPHRHLPALVIEPPATGVSVLDAQSTAADGLQRVEVYRNGALQSTPGDYSVDLGTGLITLVTPTVTTSERFVVLRELRDTALPGLEHAHLAPLNIAPLPGTTLLDMLVSDPVVDGVNLWRGGLLQAEPADYSFDASTGFVTLVTPTVAGETFQALRRVKV